MADCSQEDDEYFCDIGVEKIACTIYFLILAEYVARMSSP